MTDPCTHLIILICLLQEVLPYQSHVICISGEHKRLPLPTSVNWYSQSHILQACINHIRTVNTGLFSTWYNSYIGTGQPEPRRIIIPNIFQVLFWKENHVSHITQILQNDLALLVKAFVSAPRYAVRERVLSINKPGSSIMPGEVNLT